MTSRIAQMEEWVSRIDERAPRSRKNGSPCSATAFEALAAVNGELEEGRFLQEMVVSPDKLDVSEELTRLMHLERRAISLKSGPTRTRLTSRFRNASAKSPPAATKFRTPRRPPCGGLQERTGKVPRAGRNLE